MRPQPLISVADVEASSRWYERLLGVQGSHGGDEYQRLTHGDTLVLQLHRWDVGHDHGPIGDRSTPPYGNGVLLWFEVDDFDAVVARARDMRVEVLMEPHRNPRPDHREIWLRDPDGYTVVAASPDGEASQALGPA